MLIFGKLIPVRTLMLLAGIVALMLMTLAVPSCLGKWRSERAQARVDASQADAAAKSAGDAINTVAASGERERASDDLTRDNANNIRNAPGAGDRVNSGVDLAGRRAICKRPSYRDTAGCAMFKGVK